MEDTIKVLKDRINEVFEEHENNNINGWFDFKTALKLLENGKCVASEFFNNDTEIYLHYNVFWKDIDEQYKLSYNEINGRWKLSE